MRCTINVIYSSWLARSKRNELHKRRYGGEKKKERDGSGGRPLETRKRIILGRMKGRRGWKGVGSGRGRPWCSTYPSWRNGMMADERRRSPDVKVFGRSTHGIGKADPVAALRCWNWTWGRACRKEPRKHGRAAARDVTPTLTGAMAPVTWPHKLCGP